MKKNYLLMAVGLFLFAFIGCQKEDTSTPPVYPEAPNLVCVKIGDTWWAPVNCGYDASHPYGLLYQWGRKYGQAYEDGTITPETLTKEQGEDPANSGKFGKKDDSTNNWFSGAVDNTLWNGSSKGTYDPCPSGWRVPTADEFRALTANESGWSTNTVGGDIQEGLWFSGNVTYSESVPRVFFPAAGLRGNIDGTPKNRGDNGGYWSSSANGNNSCYMALDNHDGGSRRSYGYAVRCVKE